MKLKFRFPGWLWPKGKEKQQFFCPYCPMRVPPPSMNGLWKDFKIAIIIFIVALIILLSNIISYAQGRRLVPVKVGDEVPDILLKNVLNGPAPEMNLADYSNQLLILDFWSTSCGTCVQEMPAVAALQKQYAGKMRVIDVDFEPAAAVLRFYERRPELQALGIPVATKDTVMKQLFPHRFEPHVVWIDHGIFKAATGGEYLNARNIDQMLARGQAGLREKADVADGDASRPFITTQVRKDLHPSAPVYGCTFTGYIKGLLPGAGAVRDSIIGEERNYYTNLHLMNLYAYVLHSALPYHLNRCVLKVRDTTNYFNTRHVYQDQWDEQHSYTFDMTNPAGVQQEQVERQLQAMMEMCLGISGRLEVREVPCLIIQRKKQLAVSRYPKQKIQLDPNLAAWLHHIHLQQLADILNDVPGMLPVVKSDDQSVFDLDLPAYPTNREDWVKYLKAYGLMLRPSRRKMEMFVLTEGGRGPVLAKAVINQQP